MIKNDELGVQAYRELKKMIEDGSLVPGEKIVQDKLAARLGISRTPLRVGLQMLEAENLIMPKSNSGYQVKVISDDEILEIFECRIALESTAARLLANSIVSKDLQKLKTFFPSLEFVSDIEKYRKADGQFHHFIIEKCGNKHLYKLFQMGNLNNYIDRIGLLRPPEETIFEHFEIIEAITNHDADHAERAMRSHLEKTLELIKNKKITLGQA
jgi:DNA-binding GntR family transcriptional regulator